MDTLKTALTTALVLVCIIYSDDTGLIILAADTSLDGWGSVLMQEDENKKKYLAQYESSYWNPIEKGYDAIKYECQGVLKVLKKF